MALKRIVKVGNITNLSEARYCAGMGVDMLGFRVIEGQENYIAATTYQEIKGWIAGPEVVAELYGITDASKVAQIIADYQPDLLEFGPQELPFLPNDISLPVIYAGIPDAQTNHLTIQYSIGSISESDSGVPLLVHCEDESRLESILENDAIMGVILKGSQEERPGQQEYDHLADILEALEEE